MSKRTRGGLAFFLRLAYLGAYLGGTLSLVGTESVAAASGSLNFPVPLSPDLPFDINVEEFRQLDRDKQVPEAQRLFDIFAWRAFIALNWPAKADGTPDPDKDPRDSTSPRVWMSWRTNESVFRPDGGRPEAWDSTKDVISSENPRCGGSAKCWTRSARRRMN